MTPASSAQLTCSPVDGKRTLLGEEAAHRHVDYLQGLEQFREHGHLYELPASKREELKDDAGLCELQKEA